MNPLSAQKLKSLAREHLGKQELASAQTVLHQACKEYQDDAEAWYLLGRTESALNHTEQAITCHKNAIRLDPSSAAAHFFLAMARASLDQYSLALTSMEQCLALNDSFPNARLRISALFEKTGQYGRARQHAEQVIKNDPGNTEALGRIARIQSLNGNLDIAKGLYIQLLHANPDAFHAAAALADLQIKTGELKKASATIEPFLNRTPVPNAIVFVFSDICQFTDRCHEAIKLLEDILERSGKPRHMHRRLIFALAKLYDRIQEYDKAFEYAAEANRLKQARVSVRIFESKADHLIETWSASFNSGLPTTDLFIENIRPVFIIGMPRSGTSLTEQILASHPSVFGAGELPAISNIRKGLPTCIGAGTGYPQCLGRASGAHINACATEYLAKLRSVSGGDYPVVTDKMPENFWDLGLINLLFPSARIIHCTRDPLDTCISCYFTDFHEGHDYMFDLDSLGIYYRQYQRIILHWKNTIKIPMLELRYEDLVSKPEETSRKLVDYCGLEWSDECLSPHKNRRTVKTASFSQVRHKVYTSSVNRWKNYDAHIGELRKALGI
jgi:tetratricopeptide (TPR) repeat protein